METTYRDARKKVGLSIEDAASLVNIAPRTMCKYEAGESVPAPETALAMSRVYRVPWMSQRYCRESCAIGKAYGYEVLDAVNTDPASVLLKLVGEMAEAHAVLQRMLELAVNKNRREDFTPVEWGEFIRCLGQYMDVEHNIETLKISLGQWVDVAELVAEHNRKCLERGYVRIKKEPGKKPAIRMNFA